MTDLPRLERVWFGCFIQTCQEINGKPWRTCFPGDFQSSSSFGHIIIYKLPKLPSGVQRRRGASKWVARLDCPCTCKAVTSLQTLTLQFEMRREGKWIRSPVPSVTLLAITAWLGVCVSNTQHKAGGCAPELVAFPCCKETSVTHRMFFPYIQRGTVHPLSLVKSNAKSCLSK